MVGSNLLIPTNSEWMLGEPFGSGCSGFADRSSRPLAGTAALRIPFAFAVPATRAKPWTFTWSATDSPPPADAGTFETV